MTSNLADHDGHQLQHRAGGYPETGVEVQAFYCHDCDEEFTEVYDRE